MSFSLSLHAADPADVDLRSLLPGIRSQDPVGNCYAQTSADLLTAVYRKDGEALDSFVSPDAISVCGKIGDLQRLFADSQKDHFISQTQEYRSDRARLSELLDKLSEADFPLYLPEIKKLCEKLKFKGSADCFAYFKFPIGTKDNLRPDGTSVDGLDIGYAISTAYANCGVCFQKSFSEADNQLILQFDDQLRAFSRGDPIPMSACRSSSSIMDPETVRRLMRILHRLEAGKLKRHPAVALFQKKCKKSPIAKSALKKLREPPFLASDLEQNILKISSLLDQRIPVGISFNPVVVGKLGSGIRPAHASTIVGRRTDNGVLYFLVRSSWGEAACEQLRSEHAETAFTCDHGDFVVEASQLTTHTYRLTYFEP